MVQRRQTTVAQRVKIAICIIGVYQIANAGQAGPASHAVARAAAEVLGISPAADLGDIAAAFRRVSFRLHPEANGQANSYPKARDTYDTLCEAALALSMLQKDQVSDSLACAAPAKQSNLAITELLLAAQRGQTDTVLATLRGPCFTPGSLEARDVRCSVDLASCRVCALRFLLTLGCLFCLESTRYSA